MNSKTPSLKNIFSSFFFEYWEQIKFNFDEKRRKNIWKNVCAFLRCGNPKFGYAEYICPDCFEKLVVPFTCKSKFCPSCGIVYAEKWAHSLHEQLFNVQHLHITFSLPIGFIRDFFFFQQFKLRELADAAYSAIKYTFKKIGIYQVGVIINIHTFARDISWNPHIHAIVTLGGFNKNHKYLEKKYFHINSIVGQWKKLVIDIVKNGNYENEKLKKKAYHIASQLYHKNTRLFFDVAKNNLNNNIKAIKYIGRYLSRAPIAEYKIIDYSDGNVTFYYEDLANNKEKVKLTLDVETFLSKLIIHIPPKHFKIIKHFGIYSRNVNKEIKSIMETMRKYVSKYSKSTFYQVEIWDTFQVNPFYCFKCHVKMGIKKITYFSSRTGSIRYKEYSY